MSRPVMFRSLFVAAVVVVCSAAIAEAGEPDYDAVAANLVNESAAVKPGEIVVIGGNPGQAALMGAIQVAVAKAGGESILTISIPEANKRSVMEAPMERLHQLPTAGLLLGRIADVFINVATVEDPDLFADVPEERLAALREAGAPLNTAFSANAVRNVTLGQTGGIPTAAFAAMVGADHAEMTRMFWNASAVSPTDLAAVGRRVAATMAGGAKVRMTSEAGTNLSFEIDDRPARINAGRTADVVTGTGPASVWLPAGEAYACVKSGSASGTLVVPHMSFRGKVIQDLELIFDDGKLIKLTAGGGDSALLEEYLAASSEKTKMLSIVDIGLNSKSQQPEGSRYLSWEMGGMVSLGLGNNSWAGGDNDAEGALSLHVPDASLSIADAPVVDKGALVD